MPEIFYEKLIKNVDAHINLNVRGQTVTGYITQDITLGNSSEWGEPGMEMYGVSDLISQVSTAANMGSRFLSQAGSMGGSFAQGQIKTVQSTIANWTGSPKLPLSLTFDFLAYRSDLDVRKQVQILNKCIYPIIPETATLWITAPNGYDTTESALISVSIGRWWRTAPRFLMTSCSANFSKQVLPNGLPLRATVSVSLIAYKLLGVDEINSYFVDTAKS